MAAAAAALPLGIFHCVSKFNLIFLIVAALFNILCALANSLSLREREREIAAGCRFIYLCYFNICTRRAIVFCYYVNATAALTFAFVSVCVCVCVCVPV